MKKSQIKQKLSKKYQNINSNQINEKKSKRKRKMKIIEIMEEKIIKYNGVSKKR